MELDELYVFTEILLRITQIDSPFDFTPETITG